MPRSPRSVRQHAARRGGRLEGVVVRVVQPAGADQAVQQEHQAVAVVAHPPGRPRDRRRCRAGSAFSRPPASSRPGSRAPPASARAGRARRGSTAGPRARRPRAPSRARLPGRGGADLRERQRRRDLARQRPQRSCGTGPLDAAIRPSAAARLAAQLAQHLADLRGLAGRQSCALLLDEAGEQLDEALVARAHDHPQHARAPHRRRSSGRRRRRRGPRRPSTACSRDARAPRPGPRDRDARPGGRRRPSASSLPPLAITRSRSEASSPVVSSKRSSSRSRRPLP